MKKYQTPFLAILLAACLVWAAGSWATNQFSYKPHLNTQWTADYALCNRSQDGLNAHRGKEIWVGDPLYLTLDSILSDDRITSGIIVIPAGTHTLSSTVNRTLASGVTLRILQGGVIAIPKGRTFTINGIFQTGAYQIFSCSGSGQVRFGQGVVPFVYPEWWGAKGDNDAARATINTEAINSALNSGMPVRLAAGTYYVTSIIVPGYSDFRGQGRLTTYLKGTSEGTILKSATVDTPGTTIGIKIADLCVDGNNVASGIEIGTESRSYLSSEIHLDNIRINNVINGLTCHSLVYCSFRDLMIVGTDTVNSYGVKLDKCSGDTLFDSVTVNNFAYNWAAIDSTIHTIRCTSFSNTTDSNLVNLMYLQNSHHCVFDDMTFENLSPLKINEVLIVGLSTSNYLAQFNHFNQCKWIGTGANSTRLTVGTTGGLNQVVYSTTLNNCAFKANTFGTDIRLVNSKFDKIRGCLRTLGYTGVNHYNPLIVIGPATSKAEIVPLNNCESDTAILGTFHTGMVITSCSPKDFLGWHCTTKGTYSVPAYSATGNTDGSTAVIAGMSSTANIWVGEFVKVSSGFSSATTPYQVLVKTPTSLTLDTNSNSHQSDVVITNCLPVFTPIDNVTFLR